MYEQHSQGSCAMVMTITSFARNLKRIISYLLVALSNTHHERKMSIGANITLRQTLLPRVYTNN